LPHDPAALVSVQLVDEQLAAQVVGFVLQAPGELAGAGDGNRVLANVNADGNGAGGAPADGGDTRYGQAAFKLLLSVTAELDDLGIDQVAEGLVDVVAEDSQRRADLIRGEACAARFPDGLEQVLDEARQRVVKARHRFTAGPEKGVTQVAKRPERHARLPWVSA